ncbi:hypothetical protein ACFE04_017341 [Oxalis oulophora]
MPYETLSLSDDDIEDDFLYILQESESSHSNDHRGDDPVICYIKIIVHLLTYGEHRDDYVDVESWPREHEISIELNKLIDDRTNKGDVQATKKTTGSTKNGRDSKPKYLRVKKFGGEQSYRSNEKVGGWSPLFWIFCSGKGRSLEGLKFGSLVKGKANHPMEDYHVAKFMQILEHELGLFSIYDGHLGESVPAYLEKHLFFNILKEEEFWVDPHRLISKAYERTDHAILSNSDDMGRSFFEEPQEQFSNANSSLSGVTPSFIYHTSSNISVVDSDPYEISKLGTHRHKVHEREDGSNFKSDKALTNTTRNKYPHVSGSEIYTLDGHVRRLSMESVKSDLSSVRVDGIPNTDVGNSDLNFPRENLVIFPSDERKKLNRVLNTLEQRAATARTNVEDLIARLNQEVITNMMTWNSVKSS